jgi:hypothetical protein
MLTRALKHLIVAKYETIVIDIDYRHYEFVKSYLHAKVIFPKAKIDAELSSSRLGYHIIIRPKKPVMLIENILYRALIGDCTGRLKLSLKKLAMSNGGDDDYDHLFANKNGRNVKKLNMDKLLKPFAKDVKWIIKHWGSPKVPDKITKITEKIGKKIPKNERWVASFPFNSNLAREIVETIGESAKKCSLAKGEDSTFHYRVFKDHQYQWGFVCMVYASNRNLAYRRIAYMWRNLLKELGFDQNEIILEASNMKKERDANVRKEMLRKLHKKTGVGLYWHPKLQKNKMIAKKNVKQWV